MGSVAFLGLDEISLDMAASLLRAGYSVRACDKTSSMADQFLKLGGSICADDIEAVKGSIAVIAVSGDQCENFFTNVVGASKDVNGVVIIRSTIPHSYIQKLHQSLSDITTNCLVDVHVFKGVSKTLFGKLGLVSSGSSNAISKAKPILSAMSEKLYIMDGELGAASGTCLVIELLEAAHLVAAVEAISLGTSARIHPQILYDIISNAAGNSWVFANYIPKMLSGEFSSAHTSNFSNDVALVLRVAKSLVFPLPILTMAHQQLINGFSYKQDDGSPTLLKAWEKFIGFSLAESENAHSYSPEELAKNIRSSPRTSRKIGFVGLGAMGFGMATHLLKSQFSVIGYDVFPPSVTRFVQAGGLAGSSPADVAKDVDVLVLMVANEAQAMSVLYGGEGSVAALPFGSSIILSSTVSPSFVARLEQRLQGEQKDLKLVDAPVSGGFKKAAEGALTIMASGADEALQHAGPVLSALSEKLYIIKGGCGAGSSVKMINQLLAGVHIATSAEAMAFGAKLGLNTRLLYEVVVNSQGTSWMFENRVPHMVNNDYTPYSAVDIFVKDLGIVTHESVLRNIPLYVSSIAHQQFIAGSAAGWGRLDDASVVKVYEALTGVQVVDKPPVLNKKEVLNSLPDEWPEDLSEYIRKIESKGASKVLVVLDDDPTGTQTVHDIDVLTEWNIERLADEFNKRPSCFFILTNSRSLSSEKATALMREICTNIKIAAQSIGNIDFTVVLRGDSTLRGHFPEEADAVVSVLGEMDAWIICPFFLQGGRYTINDVHYVADSDMLIPAGDTEFAKDASFGYRSSNLCQWVEEKTKGRIEPSKVTSISISLLREGGPNAVFDKLYQLEKGSVCIVNAASDRDVSVFAYGMIQAELKGKRFLCRTAASFVSSRIGIIFKPPISLKELDSNTEGNRNGGLIVVGSYVPKTSKQVEALKAQLGHSLKCIEVSVDRLAMRSLEEREEEIHRAADMADVSLHAGKDTLVITSRDLITGSSPSESLEINYKVSSALVDIVRLIRTRPRYILAKGGITSSDIATKGLGAKRARVVGQALAGVPLWQLGPESRHPGVPYIVFPGNVGDNNAVADVVKNWSTSFSQLSTRDILLHAKLGGYAVGAFNIYNLEGIQAVVAAAEAERSPAILQIHPSALKQGGLALVAACVAAANESSVPITVHFDHGNSRQELVEALELGFHSIMVDGSHFPYSENMAYTKYITTLAHSKNLFVEAELGRLSGTEDEMTVEDYEARLTDVTQAEHFITETRIDALAVCIGNVHGKYPASGPSLRLDLLKDLQAMASGKDVILVLHGASGLPEELVQECIKLGIRKFNVNTEVRSAYMESLKKSQKDLVHVMASARDAMQTVIAEKMHLFGSARKA